MTGQWMMVVEKPPRDDAQEEQRRNATLWMGIPFGFNILLH